MEKILSDLYIEIFQYKNLKNINEKILFANKIYLEFIKDSNLFTTEIKNKIKKELYEYKRIDNELFREIEFELIK